MKVQQVTAGGLIFNSEGKFLIVQRALTDDFMPGYWELSSGGSKYGETPQEAVRREVKEECGIDVVVHTPLAVDHYFIGETQRIMIVFLCTFVDKNQSIRLSEEHSASAWIPPEEIDTYHLSPFMQKLLRDALKVGAKVLK